jgi:hypothetical protein
MKMEKGQRSIITITDPALAYGSKGYTGTSGTPVPPDTPVTFDLTLNSFDTIKEKWSMDNSEKVGPWLGLGGGEVQGACGVTGGVMICCVVTRSH